MKFLYFIFLLLPMYANADLKLLNYELGSNFEDSSDKFFKYSNNFFSLNSHDKFITKISVNNYNIIKSIQLQSKNIFNNKESCNKTLSYFFYESKKNYSFSSINDHFFYLSNKQSFLSFEQIHESLNQQYKLIQDDFNNKYSNNLNLNEKESQELYKNFNNELEKVKNTLYSVYENSYIIMLCNKISYDSNFYYYDITAEIDDGVTDTPAFPYKPDAFYLGNGITVGKALPSNLNYLNKNNTGSFSYQDFVINIEYNYLNEPIVVAAYLDPDKTDSNYSIQKCFNFINFISANNFDINSQIEKMNEYKPSFYITFNSKNSINGHITCDKERALLSVYTNKNLQSN